MPNFHQQELFALDARREQARALRRAGHTVPEIQERLGVESYYRALALVADIPPPNPKFRARAKDDVKARARELREQGKTYTEIAETLGVSKSSCSLWCKDLPRPAPAPGRVRASTWGPRLERREQQRTLTKRTAATEIGALTPHELLLVGAALYWAEGEKDKPYSRRERINFTNSDPAVVRVFMRWLELVGVSKTECVFRIQIHETADVAAAHEFWAGLLGIGVEEFARPTLKRHNPKTNRRNRGVAYNGCIIIRVRQSARLYQRVEGWWQGMVLGATSGTLGA